MHALVAAQALGARGRTRCLLCDYKQDGDQMKLQILVVALFLISSAAFAAEESNKQTAAAAAGGGDKPYGTVIDGTKVNSFVMEGFRTWRSAACDRCHGANQQGLVGPSLIDSLKTLTKEQFVQTITEGRVEKGMPPWKESKNVMDHIDNLYAYLKGRSDGAITQAHVQEQK
jgi:mono/diheme cytochrome c family protein